MYDLAREYERERSDDLEIGARAPDHTDQRARAGWVRLWVEIVQGDRVGHRTLVRTMSERSSEVADEGEYRIGPLPNG